MLGYLPIIDNLYAELSHSVQHIFGFLVDFQSHNYVEIKGTAKKIIKLSEIIQLELEDEMNGLLYVPIAIIQTNLRKYDATYVTKPNVKTAIKMYRH